MKTCLNTLKLHALSNNLIKNDFDNIVLLDNNSISFSSHFKVNFTDGMFTRYIPTGYDFKYVKQLELLIDNVYIVWHTKDLLNDILKRNGTIDLSKLNKKTNKRYRGYILFQPILSTRYSHYIPHFFFEDISKCVKKVSLIMKQEPKDRQWTSVVSCRNLSSQQCVTSDTCVLRNGQCFTYPKYQIQPLNRLNLSMKPYKFYMFTEFQVNDIKTVFKMDSKHIYAKPFGLWFAVGDEWLQHMKKTNFWMSKYNYLYELELKKDKLIVIDSMLALQQFSSTYGIGEHKDIQHQGQHFRLAFTTRIDWHTCVKKTKTQGIIISPNFKTLYYKYDHHNHFSDVFKNIEWYLKWDVASGVIWDTHAIQKMTLVYKKQNGYFMTTQ